MSTPISDLTTLVSLFHTQTEASKAMSELLAAGIPAQSIETLGGGDTSATAAPESSLATLKSLDLPAHDLGILADGLKSGGLLLVVRAEHAMAQKAEEIFEHHAHQKDERTTTIPQTQPVAVAATVGGETVIPIVEEVLNIGKRKVERGAVRVVSRLVETPVEEQVVLQEEHVTVERHKVNRSISSTELDTLQNQTLEVREMAEEAVVAKSARVIEEVRIGKDTTERSQQIKDTLRKTEVDVDPLGKEELHKAR